MDTEVQRETGGLLRGVGLRSATALVVANMIGAGIFTSTGFQAAALGHPGYIFALWILGGVLALCGALCFAELGALMPEAGAEYVYIRETFGRALGFMSAVVGLIAGFSAPIAAALKGFVSYAAYFAPALASETRVLGVFLPGDLAAIALAWALVAIHARGLKLGMGFGDAMTLLKVLGILLIVLGALVFRGGDLAHLTAVAPAYADLSFNGKMSAFATSLIFVGFCYLGWNAAAYMASEMKEPQKTLPRSLLLGTALVTVLYLALNLVYFYAAGVEGLAGKVEVGRVAAEALFGPVGVTLVTLVLLVSILASASAMTVVGPRVYYAFGKDVPLLRILARVHPKRGAPVAALLLQGAVTSAIILSGRIDAIMHFAGFTLTLFSGLAVACVPVLRIRRPDAPRPFRAWGYPFTPLLYIGMGAWTMVWSYRSYETASLLGFAAIALSGLLFYGVSRVQAHNEKAARD